MEATLNKALDDVRVERERQDRTWGEQNHPPGTWLSILVEEVGEVAKAQQDMDGGEYRNELVQVAAVAVAMIEAYDRNGGTVT